MSIQQTLRERHVLKVQIAESGDKADLPIASLAKNI
jgi:hypothetical protein